MMSLYETIFLIFFICVPLVMCRGHTVQGEMNSEGAFGL